MSKKLSQVEITAARSEVKPTAEECAAEALRLHTESLRPRQSIEPDVRPDWLTNVQPRWCGVVQQPIDGGK